MSTTPRPGLNRREFVKQSALLAGSTFAIGGTKSSGNILGANESIRVACAGLNGRGASHVGAYAGMKSKGVEVTYLVDPDSRTFAARAKTIKEQSGVTPKEIADIREALDDKNVDVVSIATPNHWHALMTIWSCQAGKDVYVEKPCSHNVHEGRVAVEAARKFNRIVQHGTQNRSNPEKAKVMDVIKSGQLGKLLISRGLCYKNRNSIGVKQTKAPPSVLDFNLWTGPAAEQPFHDNLVPYNWHWFWDFGNGDIGNQGVHEMDLARWAIPGATLPKSVLSVGGRFGYKDQGQTANTQIAIFDFGETQLIFETRGRPTKPFHTQGVGNVYHLEAGIIAGTTFYPKGSTEAAPLPKVESSRGPSEGGGDNGHFGNFIAAVRSRKQTDLNADILEGHYSSALCHLANISYRLGSEAPFTTKLPAFEGNAAALETLERTAEHLKDDVKLDLAQTDLRVGRRLTVDAGNETIMGDTDAQALLTRNYRKPFIVPDVA
ncbi:MAG: putative dehydrogenase [Planctomycetaceae bacterium]|nr:putative dehydrogenase [Planctomycetaceae bacterium]